MEPTALDPLQNALSSLSQVRLALPATLLGLLVLRAGARAFLAMMDTIQAQGWAGPAEEDEPIPASTNPEARGNQAKAGEEGAEEGEVEAVVVKAPGEIRRGLVFGVAYLIGAAYFAEGAAHVIASLIRQELTPSLPLYAHSVEYTAGGLAAFALLGAGLIWDERKVGLDSLKAVYVKVFTVIGLLLELAALTYLASVLRLDRTIGNSTAPLPAFVVALVALRLLLYAGLLLSLTRVLYRSAYLPVSDGTAGERTSLLNPAGGATAADATEDAAADYGAAEARMMPKNTLRASRPPSNRPPDAKSLSMFAFFTRIKVLYPYLWPSKSRSLQALAVVCVFLMLLKRVVNIITPILFGRVIQDLVEGRPPYINVGLYCLASFLQDTNQMLYRYLWLPIEQFSEREISQLSFDTLLNLSLSYHTRRRTGELLRILSRSDAINNFFQSLVFDWAPILLDLPLAVVVLWVRYGFAIVGIVLVVSVIFVSTSLTLAESRIKMVRQLRDENQLMHQIKTDTLFNYETVKIFTSERFESNRLLNSMRSYQRGAFAVYSAWNSLSLIQDGISSLGLLACSFVLAGRVVRGEMDVGSFVTFTSYLAQLYAPLNRIASVYRQIMSNLVDTEQLMELLQEEKDIVDRPDAQELVVGTGGIEFDNVKFSYDGGKSTTLKGVSFKIEAGQSVALVGPSGGGKSTIMRLLYRFYDVTEGSIKIDGVDIRDLTQESLRHNIGLVPQESILFNETARFNIAYGAVRPDGWGPSEQEIVQASKAASIHDRIMSFPDQYETRVGERGQRLSGGEKQRIAIARVILKNPPLLLLDEATSALDTVNEQRIQVELNKISKGRTTLAIAHRLSTVANSDVIFCMDEGRIVEAGSHGELLARGGVYADLWAKQVEGQNSAAPSVANTRPGTPVDGAGGDKAGKGKKGGKGRK